MQWQKPIKLMTKQVMPSPNLEDNLQDSRIPDMKLYMRQARLPLKEQLTQREIKESSRFKPRKRPEKLLLKLELLQLKQLMPQRKLMQMPSNPLLTKRALNKIKSKLKKMSNNSLPNNLIKRMLMMMLPNLMKIWFKLIPSKQLLLLKLLKTKILATKATQLLLQLKKPPQLPQPKRNERKVHFDRLIDRLLLHL